MSATRDKLRSGYGGSLLECRYASIVRAPTSIAPTESNDVFKRRAPRIPSRHRSHLNFFRSYSKTGKKVAVHDVSTNVAQIIRIVRQGFMTSNSAIVDEGIAWLPSITEQARVDSPFSEKVLSQTREWVQAFRSDALAKCKDLSLHARVRWLLLELLAATPDDSIRDLLVELLEQPALDPWLMNGVPAVIRSTAMLGHRERVAAALRVWLNRAQAEPARYGDHVRACGIGEMIIAFGSVAQAGDFERVGSFALGDWQFKVKINALDAMERIAQRHSTDVEIGVFFVSHRQEMLSLGRVLAFTSRGSQENGPLFLSWLGAMTARLGPETEDAWTVAREFSRYRKRFAYQLDHARKALDRRGATHWNEEAKAQFEKWQKILAT